MKNYHHITSIIMLLLLSLFFCGFSQQKVESRLKAIENELSQIQQKQYDIISHNNFLKAREELNRSKKAFNEGKSINDIMERLEKASRYIRLVNDIGQQGKILFENTLAAREDALVAQAPEFAEREFADSEKDFLSASDRLEKGDLNGARKYAGKAEEQYRVAEVIAIKENIVGKVRDLLTTAQNEKVDELANITFNDAEALYLETIKILEGDRYAKTNARDMAKQAEYQVKHAMYLSQKIEELRQDDSNWELIFRNFEDRFDEISSELGFKGQYESGLAQTEKDIILAIRNIQEENKTLKSDLKQLQADNIKLNDKVQQYENTVLTELEKKKAWEAKLLKIEQMFTKDEAQVLLSGDEMIIRLYGLTFRSGTAVILPEHYMLLTKVMRALREFPGQKYQVGGHTDAQGNDSYNLALSENRAAAIRAYLEANMGLSPEQVTSIGYGERLPIASNETVDGRKLNRRIEIKIDLESN